MPHKSKNILLQYDRSKIPLALEKIKRKEMSIRKASREYGIPFSTLRDRTSGRIPENAHPGVPTVLSKYEENSLADYIVKCADMGVGKSMQQVKEMAAMIVHKDPQRSHIAELWTTKLQAGNDWYYAFLARQPQLSLRTPEKLSQVRAKMTNEAVLKKCYDTLEPYLFDKTPACVFNADEVGMPLDFKPHKVVASKKTHSLYSLNSGDKTQVTVLACGNAAGTMIPPAVIFPGKRINNVLVQSAPQGWYVQFTESGWIRSEAFENWFSNVFIPYINKEIRPHNREQKVVLLLDGHKSHETLKTIKEAQENHVDIICLPPNTTHLLQPLDVTFFKSLKVHWNRENEAYCRENHGVFVKKGSFMQVFQKSWDKCCQKTGVVSNGFKRVGIAPYKRLALGDIQSDKILFPSAGLNTPLQSTSPSSSASTSEAASVQVSNSPESLAELEESNPETQATAGVVNTPLQSTSPDSSPNTSDAASVQVSNSPESLAELEESNPETQETAGVVNAPLESTSPGSSANTNEAVSIEASNGPESLAELEESNPETQETAGVMNTPLQSTSPGSSAITSEATSVEFLNSLESLTEFIESTSLGFSATNSEAESAEVSNTPENLTALEESNLETQADTANLSEYDNEMSSCIDLLTDIDAHLNTVFTLPSFTQAPKRVRKTNPHCRILTSNEVILEKERMMDHELEKQRIKKERLEKRARAAKEKREKEVEKQRIRKEKEEKKAKAAKEKLEKAKEKAKLKKMQEAKKAREKAKNKKLQTAKKASEKAKSKKLQTAKKNQKMPYHRN